MIEFESVGKTYKDGTSAVVDLDLVVPSGQITVIVGPSGCGKTTTLRMVNRMLEPTSGRILWDGTPVKARRKTTLRRQMGYVIQSGGLFPHRTVLDNIGTVPSLLRWNRQKTQSRSMELLGSVGLDRKLANRYPAQLSGGQQQRVGVARALAADPLVMLMDEPFSAVDPVVRSELHEFFLNLQRELSKTIILITHDIDEAIKLGDKVAILRVGGKLAQAGTPQELLDNPADAFVEGFVGRDRGYRSLSFMPSSSLDLERVQAVRDAAAPTDEHALVIDKAAKPLGWTDPRQPGRTLPLGSTFDPEKDNLRVALDAALTSPAGLAVAVGKDGRYAGVVSAAAILHRVAEVRSTRSDAITVQSTPDEDGAEESGTAPESSAESSAESGDGSSDASSDRLSGATAVTTTAAATTTPESDGASDADRAGGPVDRDLGEPVESQQIESQQIESEPIESHTHEPLLEQSPVEASPPGDHVEHHGADNGADHAADNAPGQDPALHGHPHEEHPPPARPDDRAVS